MSIDAKTIQKAEKLIRSAASPAHADAVLERMAGLLALSWLVRTNGDPYDGRQVERITLAILDTLDRQR